MREMEIYGVSFDLVGKQPIVLLKTADGNKFLPIWIGHPEAAAILQKLQNASTVRPMTHDLLADVLGQLEAEVVSVAVTELRENTFYARITIRQNGSELEIDSRPSDAIALAVRFRATIYAADEVIEESGIEFEGEGVESEEGAGATPLSELLGPLKLDPLTVADDGDFLDQIERERNLPEFVAKGLRGLYPA
jgi:bifunctional DNase/RNase